MSLPQVKLPSLLVQRRESSFNVSVGSCLLLEQARAPANAGVANTGLVYPTCSAHLSYVNTREEYAYFSELLYACKACKETEGTRDWFNHTYNSGQLTVLRKYFPILTGFAAIFCRSVSLHAPPSLSSPPGPTKKGKCPDLIVHATELKMKEQLVRFSVTSPDILGTEPTGEGGSFRGDQHKDYNI